MRARHLIETIADWLPDTGGVTYQCRSCGTMFDTPQTECPDCEGEVDELVVEPTPPGMGPMG